MPLKTPKDTFKAYNKQIQQYSLKFLVVVGKDIDVFADNEEY